MTHIKQMIEDARKGGYERYAPHLNDAYVYERLLDPTFWSAVGKTRGWRKIGEWETTVARDQWKEEMHRFVDHILDGDDLEDALSKIS